MALVLRFIRVIPREENSDTMSRAKPFGQAAHQLPTRLPERFKSQSTLFREDACSTFLDNLSRNDIPSQARSIAASELGKILKDIQNEKMVSDSICILRETMADDSEHPSLRTACAEALGLSGRLEAAIELEGVLNGIPNSVFSRLLAVKALSLQRGDYALNALMDAVEFGKIPEVRFAAAMELASMGIPRARQAAAHFIATTRYSEHAMKVREALSSEAAN